MFVFSVFSSSEQITLSGKQETEMLHNEMLPKFPSKRKINVVVMCKENINFS